MPNTNINYSYNAEIAPEIKDYYDTKLLETVKKDCVYLRDLEPKELPLNQSGTIEFRRAMPLEPNTTPLKEGVTPEGKKIKIESFTATVAPYGDYIESTDELDWRTLDNAQRVHADLLAQQAKESIDDIAKRKLGAGLNVRYAGNKTKRGDITATDVLTGELLKKVVRDLKKNGAKPFADGSFHGIIDSSTAYDLRNDPMFIDVAKYQDGEKFNDLEIGKLAGVRLFETNNGLVYQNESTLVEGIAQMSIVDYVPAEKYFTLKSTELSKLTMDVCRALAGKLVNFVDNAGTGTHTACIDRVTTDGKVYLRYDTPAMATATWKGGNALMKPTGGGSGNAKVYGTLVYGKDFGSMVSLGSGGGKPQTIIKPLGSSGTNDPLNQRQTIAWKVKGFTATITQDLYIVRVEHGATEN